MDTHPSHWHATLLGHAFWRDAEAYNKPIHDSIEAGTLMPPLQHQKKPYTNILQKERNTSTNASPSPSAKSNQTPNHRHNHNHKQLQTTPCPTQTTAKRTAVAASA